MDYIESIVLGIVQGLTEFLPVSSSGHLELVKSLFGNSSLPKESLLMTVVLHFATALSTFFIYRKDLLSIFKNLFKFENNEDFRFSVKIILSMIPAVFVGLVFEKEIESLFQDSVLLVGFMLLITSLLLLLADKATSTGKDLNYTNSIIVGISQAIAILPGISRSGATISTSVLLGIDRKTAARFSFLMVVPLILGKIAKDILGGDLIQGNEDLTSLSLGFIAAFISGLFACTWMIKLVQKSKLTYFSIYCAIVGATAITISFI